jgi:predicted NBD/HSP70 family sugar kinase
MVDVQPGIQRERMNGILKELLDSTRLTRGSLAAALRLSPSSIVKYTKVLIEKGLVRETDRERSTGGRRSTLLELNPDAGLSIVVVLEATSLRGALVDTAGRTIGEEMAPSHQGIEREELLEILYGLLDRLLAHARVFPPRILGIGIGLGGFIDPVQGVSHEYLYARDWYDVPVRQLVEARYSLPCYLVNDANACALGEKHRGAGVGIENFLCVMIGEGVGMGIVANGELYTGKCSYAGEFGHMHVVDDGLLCYCGHTGCLETVCSQQAILSACRDGLRQGVNSDILKYCAGDSERITIEYVIDAANNGDRFARNVMVRAGDALGAKLADVANLLNPELIILRGPVIDGNAFLFERISGVAKHESLRPTARALRIEYSPERSDIRFAGVGSAILMDYFTR